MTESAQTVKTNPMAGYYGRLKKRLGIGTLAVNTVLLAITAWLWPDLLKPLALGMGIGAFYLWSLMRNAEHPQGKLQFAFSLIRMIFLAYVIVKVGHAQVRETAIVICGLLSYKVILTAETVVQALPAFRIRRPSVHPTRGSR